MKTIAVLSLNSVGINDQSTHVTLSLSAHILTSEIDNFTYDTIVPFPQTASDLNSTLKENIITKIASALNKTITPEDIFLAGDLVIDSNDQVAQISSDIKAVQDNVATLQAVAIAESAQPANPIGQ